MGPMTRKVWTLWPTLDEMAADLNESINALRRLRDAGELPDPKWDYAIKLKARSLGKQITQADLDEIRAMTPAMQALDLDARRRLIGGFYEAAGGTAVVEHRTGVSVRHLAVNKSRGWLNVSKRYEYQQLADEVGFDLPSALFSRPKG